MTDYIVAIDLGTSHITGIVGERKTNEIFTIVACETEDSASCIRRGIIYNRDNTAIHVRSIIKKLESHLKGDFIDKIYIGVNGQSLHTVDHIEVKEIAEGAAITKEDVDALKKQCEDYRIDLQDVLDIVPAVYYVDGRRDTNPVGVPCKRFEAHYKLVVGRSSIRRDIFKSIGELAGKEIAGIIVSPLALADAMLSREEKDLGCALVDFGAGVTSVSVYKDGDLKQMSVIPLGGNLITRDITSMQLTEAVSENLKREYGSTIILKEDDDEQIQVDMEGADCTIEKKDLNTIIEGRAREIVENVYARINETIDIKTLASGIVLAGCASELKNLPDMLKEKCKIKVRPSTIRGGLVAGSDDMLGNPLHMLAISLMLKGTEQCISRSVTVTDNVIDENKENEDEDAESSGGFFRRRKNGKNGKSGYTDRGAGTAGDKNTGSGGKKEGEGGLGGFFGRLFDES